METTRHTTYNNTHRLTLPVGIARTAQVHMNKERKEVLAAEGGQGVVALPCSKALHILASSYICVAVFE